VDRVRRKPETSKPADETIDSIAVLPFANLGGDPEQDYFCEGLAEEILNALTRVPGLRVTARTSSFSVRGKDQDIRQIGQALNVRSILEGCVRHAGNHIRISVQLIHAGNGYHLWSESYDREMTDVFALQDEIAAAIVEALQLKLAGKPVGARRHQPTLPAYEAFLRARHALLKIAPESAARAKQLLEQAIALDIEYAEPYAELGWYYFLQSIMGLRRARETMPVARAQAEKALELAPEEPRAHAVLCAVAGSYDSDWKEAGERFRRTLASEPVPSEARALCALYYLLPLGRFQEALGQFEKALEQDPLNVFIRGAFALVLSFREMHDRALAEAQKAVEIDESHWLPYFAISFSNVLRGDLTEARNAAERSVRAAWHFQPIGLLAGILARLGNKERADELVLKLREMGPAHERVGLLLYHVLCSGTDAAADWYAAMVEDRDPFAAVWSIMKPLRSSPRWPVLAKMMNLPAEAI
jgi:serine/threonine-protein kinase